MTAVQALTATQRFGLGARPGDLAQVAGGTDHGTASCAFLMGGATEGGRVLADWPGLDRSRLYQGRDLAPTMDLRALAKGVLQDHLGLPADALARVVFPGSDHVAPLRDLVRAQVRPRRDRQKPSQCIQQDSSAA